VSKLFCEYRIRVSQNVPKHTSTHTGFDSDLTVEIWKFKASHSQRIAESLFGHDRTCKSLEVFFSQKTLLQKLRFSVLGTGLFKHGFWLLCDRYWQWFEISPAVAQLFFGATYFTGGICVHL
jgi:hypothetical protein